MFWSQDNHLVRIIWNIFSCLYFIQVFCGPLGHVLLMEWVFLREPPFLVLHLYKMSYTYLSVRPKWTSGPNFSKWSIFIWFILPLILYVIVQFLLLLLEDLFIEKLSSTLLCNYKQYKDLIHPSCIRNDAFWYLSHCEDIYHVIYPALYAYHCIKEVILS